MTFTKKHFAPAISLAIICWGVSQSASSAGPGPGPAAWEYKVTTDTGRLSADALTSVGRDGWELVTVTAENNLYQAVFKRAKQ